METLQPATEGTRHWGSNEYRYLASPHNQRAVPMQLNHQENCDVN